MINHTLIEFHDARLKEIQDILYKLAPHEHTDGVNECDICDQELDEAILIELRKISPSERKEAVADDVETARQNVRRIELFERQDARLEELLEQAGLPRHEDYGFLRGGKDWSIVERVQKLLFSPGVSSPVGGVSSPKEFLPWWKMVWNLDPFRHVASNAAEQIWNAALATSPSPVEHVRQMEREHKTRLEAWHAQGWMVAVHNDYRIHGELFTFWLLTNDCGRYVKGEGSGDEAAFDQIEAAMTQLNNDLSEQDGNSPATSVESPDSVSVATHLTQVINTLEGLAQSGCRTEFGYLSDCTTFLECLGVLRMLKESASPVSYVERERIRKEHAQTAAHNEGLVGMPQGPCQCEICRTPSVERDAQKDLGEKET